MAEKHLRVEEVAGLTGYSVATIRKKIARREVGYRKIGRIIAIPESELTRLLGAYRAPVVAGGKSR